MKRILALLLALSMLLVFSGCSYFDKIEEEVAFDVEECLVEAEALVKAGELKEAERLLKKGIRKTAGDEELKAYLEVVQGMMDEDASHVETMPATTAPMATTEIPPQTEATAGTNMVESFGAAEMKRINIFLSNFSEQGFRAYPCDTYTLIGFGYRYAKINNREVLGVEGYEYFVNKADMDSILTRFFNTTVQVPEGTATAEMRYSNGTYYFPAADGANVSYCTVATSMVDNGNGAYTVTFNIYQHVHAHESMSAFYSMTPAQAAASSELVLYGSGTAVVRDYVRSSGVESYQLLSYSLN